MAAVTTTWEIPYPQDTDRFCDGYLYTQQMAERIDEILDEFDVDSARARVVPLARVSVLADQITSDLNPFAAFDTVDFDTAGLANLAQAETPLEVLDGTYLIIGGDATWTEAGGTAGDSYDLEGGFSTGSVTAFRWRQRDAGSNAIMRATFASLQRAVGGDVEFVGILPTHSGTVGTRTVDRAVLWIMKFGDV